MSHISRRRLAAIAASAIVPAVLALPPGEASAAPSGGQVKVIVEFDGPTATGVVGLATVARSHGNLTQAARRNFHAEYAGAKATVERQQDAVISRLSAAGVKLNRHHRVTGVLDAVVAEVDPAALSKLRSTPGISRVTVDATAHILNEANIPATGAPQVWEKTDAKGAHIKGDGVTVAVIDTGIDYSLPDLGGGFGPGHRVVDGYDFVNNDNDPMDDNLHGTHVAGTIGAGGANLTGMAPDVTLTAWKAMDRGGSGTIANLLLALDAATDPLSAHPADVVNMSLGMPGDGADPVGRAATAAVQQGTIVVAAAGNAGPNSQTISTPAAAPGVIAVGAEITGVSDPTLTLDGDTPRKLDVTRFPLSANPPSGGITAKLVDVGDGSEAGYAAAGDVTGDIVVMQSYPVTSLGDVLGYHLAQATIAEQHGAAGVLLYGASPTDPGQVGGGGGVFGQTRVLDNGGFDLRRKSLVMMNISSALYQTFKKQVLAGTAKATIGSTDQTDKLAGFSSRGPSDAMTLKPEIVAPGFEIMSDIPSSFDVDGNQYRDSGTSMASPHVAGAAALMVQAHPEKTAAQARAALIGSAQPLASSDAKASPSAQGAGKLDVAAAVDQHVTAAPDAVSFGLADMSGRGNPTETVVLHNSAATAVTIDLAVQASSASTGKATLSKSKVTVAAGRDTSVELTINPTIGTTDGETSGVLVGTVSDGTTVRVPYAAYVRPLQIQATPSPATGQSQVFVYSPMAPDGAMTLTATAPSGAAATTSLTAVGDNPGWYRGTVPLGEVGTYRLDAKATVGGRTLTGDAVIQSEQKDQPGDWEQVGLLGTGESVAMSPGAPGTALATAPTGVNPFLTTDYGKTWTRVRSMPVADGWGIPVADTSKPGGFFLALNSAAGSAVLDPSYHGRIVHTPDAGKTWTVLPFPDVAISKLVGHRSALAAIVGDGAYLSTDAGQTWRHIPAGWDGSVTGAAFSGSDLLVSTFNGIYRVADAAGGGTEVVRTFTPKGFSQSVSAMAADDNAAVGVGFNGNAIVSSDHGATWTDKGPSGQGYVTSMAAVDGSIYLNGLSSFSTSTDGGETWTSHPLPVRGPVAMDVDHWPGRPAGDVLMTMEGAGLYQTKDGTTWTKSGIAATTVSGVSVGTSGDGTPVLRAVDGEGMHVRALSALGTDAQDWGSIGHEGLIGAQLRQVAQSPVGDRKVWAIGNNATGGAVIKTGGPDATDAKLTKVGPKSELTPFALAVSPIEPQTVAVSYGSISEAGFMVSHDGFATWRTHADGRRINQILFDPSNADRIWLATDDGLYRTDDGGETEKQLTTTPVKSVHVDPADPSHVVVGKQPGVAVSFDGGATFADATIPDSYANIVALVGVTVPDGPKAGAPLLVAGSAAWRPHGLTANGSGAFVSADGGRTWTPASAGLNAMSIRSLTVSPDGKAVYAGTDTGGVHRTSTSALVPPDVVVTRTTLTTPAPIKVGDKPKISVQVTPADRGPVTGTVVVHIVRQGGGASYSGIVKLGGGKADYRMPAIATAGTYDVVATYQPTGSYATSTGTTTFVVS
ncbi:S8 family serine peptidase [Streptomyces sp. NPDC056291]|uniref:S8 family serine peptidase n=1 Tax=Streptomyces sp. NPDC056291 TaxID=3345772 RepID=UPI0035E26D96